MFKASLSKSRKNGTIHMRHVDLRRTFIDLEQRKPSINGQIFLGKKRKTSDFNWLSLS